MIGWFSYTLPVGLSIYWNIFSIFSIWQYQQLKIKAPSGGKK
jgi:YidC/Oxa1 family membrane protein insertase